jgi:hypothetical protein
MPSVCRPRIQNHAKYSTPVTTSRTRKAGFPAEIATPPVKTSSAAVTSIASAASTSAS